MSEENVALVRRLHDLFNGRDLEGMLELLHPEVRVGADHGALGPDCL
jgi:hypothetical protein